MQRKIELEDDPVLTKILNELGLDKLPQAQYSTSAQLRNLHRIAQKFGMYDAADLLKRTFDL